MSGIVKIGLMYSWCSSVGRNEKITRKSCWTFATASACALLAHSIRTFPQHCFNASISSFTTAARTSMICIMTS